MAPSILIGFPYRHYRGGLYLPVAVAERHTHNGDLDVVYVSMTHAKHCTRPLAKDSRGEDSWLDEVTWPDGRLRTRFALDSSKLRALFEGGSVEAKIAQ
jgi:Protein of unknown function (DUF1653)